MPESLLLVAGSGLSTASDVHVGGPISSRQGLAIAQDRPLRMDEYVILVQSSLRLTLPSSIIINRGQQVHARSAQPLSSPARQRGLFAQI